MKRIIIKSQEDVDNLPEKFKEYTEILIDLPKEKEININRADGNSSVRADGNSSVIADGNSSVIADGNSSVIADGNSSVRAYGNSSVRAYGNSSVRAYGNSSVIADGNSSVIAYGNSSVRADGNSSVIADGNSSVRAYGNSSVRAYGNSSVIAYGNSSVIADGNSSVIADGNSSVRAYGNSSVKILDEYVELKEARGESVIICIGCKVKCRKKDKTSTILYKKKFGNDIDSFIRSFDIKKTGNSIILYKSVKPEDNTDFYSGKIKYEGNVEAPDWNPDKSIECGNGLHLSPLPELALSFNNGKILECEVNIKDIAIFPFNIQKVRCKKVRVIGEWKKDKK